jgi:hypothetical protein
MPSHKVSLAEVRWQEHYALGSQAKSNSPRQPAALREEDHVLDVTDRETMYGESFRAEWARLSNYSPDDFE